MGGENPKQSGIGHPGWARNATIYEVNIRHYTKEGTFNAFADHLPRLNEMGVKILWIMPIHPIGKKNRKGRLGSPYSISDYRAIHPDLGTLEDFKNLVRQSHHLGMKVLMDWVANHTAWDHIWTEQHPDWYQKTEEGEFHSPEDWSDVIALDYENDAMRDAMVDAMEFWVREADVDGFRCDVAFLVPLDFWNRVRSELEKLKPDIFMLAEGEEPEHHERAFDMSFGWRLHKLLLRIERGEEPLSALDDHMQWEKETFPEDAYRMFFTSNHDENKDEGSDWEMYGENYKNYAVLAFTVHGMPLIFGGQESGPHFKLNLFEQDRIEWGDYPNQPFYEELIALKKSHPALLNGKEGGDYQHVETGGDDGVFAFKRIKEDHELFVILNFSDEVKKVSFSNNGEDVRYKEYFTDDEIAVAKQPIELGAHHFLVLGK